MRRKHCADAIAIFQSQSHPQPSSKRSYYVTQLCLVIANDKDKRHHSIQRIYLTQLLLFPRAPKNENNPQFSASA